MLLIDGSQLEGGGQILRITSALSCVLKIPVQVNKIRAGRAKGGLKAQHLSGLKLIQEISDGELVGGSMDSMEVNYKPNEIKGRSLLADTRTAGSVSLLIQSILPCALFGSNASKSTITLRGGTNADMAPQIDYTMEVFKKIAEKFGIGNSFNIKLNRRGFFPKGGGEVIVDVNPLKEHIKSIEMIDRGHIVSIKGISLAAGVLPVRVAHEMAECASRLLRKHVDPQVKISISSFKESNEKAFGNGSAIVLWAETSTGCVLGGSALGKRGLNNEEVGTKAAKELIDCFKSNGCVDSYAQDQIIIFMALANGTSRVRTGPVTLHTQTAIHIARKMSRAQFKIIEDSDTETNIIECIGIGALPHSL